MVNEDKSKQIIIDGIKQDGKFYLEKDSLLVALYRFNRLYPSNSLSILIEAIVEAVDEINNP